MSKKIFFTVEDRIQEMVLKIKEKNGYATLTQVWTQAMIEMHAREFKDYVVAKSVPSARNRMTPEEKVAHQDEIKKLKEKSLKDKKLAILKKLGGKLITGADGNETAQWYTYWSAGKDLQEMSLMSLTEDLVANQFQGNIQKIKEFHQLK